MKSKTKRTKKTETKAKELNSKLHSGGDPNKVPFWREIAGIFLEGEDDQWRLGEAALAMQFFAGLLCRNFEKLGRSAESTHVIKSGFALKVDRSAHPPMVSMKLNGPVSKISDMAESDVPDASQTDLPGYEQPEESGEVPEHNEPDGDDLPGDTEDE